MAFIDIRDEHTNKLLFRFDPQRDLIEIQVRGVKSLIDLSQYRRADPAPRQPARESVSLN